VRDARLKNISKGLFLAGGGIVDEAVSGFEGGESGTRMRMSITGSLNSASERGIF
jgi:hypothetical protein